MMLDCPCCGQRLLLDARLLASPLSAPAAPCPPEQPEADVAADDAVVPCPAAQASGMVHDCCECLYWQEEFRGSEWGTCCSDRPGGKTLRRRGGCVNNFVARKRGSR